MKTSICGSLALLAAINFCTGSGAQTPPPGPKPQVISLEDPGTTLTRVIAYSNAGKLTSKPALALLSGEARAWQTPSLGTLEPKPDKIMHIDATHAVGRTQHLGKDKQVTDYYFYLLKDKSGWKVEDCRSLSSIGIVWEARKKLLAKKNPTAEQKYQIANMTLLLSSDAAIKSWFDKNKSKLDSLYRNVKALPKPYPPSIKASDKKYKSLAKEIELLAIDSISMHESGELQVIIGGIDRDFVGLLYSAGGKKPPIESHSWLWVEDLGGHWYLFRHT